MSIVNAVLNWWYSLHGKFPETIRWDRESGQGSSGKTVQMWQQVLGVTPDGSFGPQTDAATRAWQAAHGIDPDGVVGPLTWTAAMKTLGTAEKPSTGGLPPGTRRLPQSVANSPAITAFAIETLNDPSNFPMGATNRRTIDGVDVLARVEKHDWTHRNGVLVTHLNPPIRGITLYQVTDPSQFAGEDPVVWRVSEHGGEYSIQRDPGGHMMETGSEAEVGCSDFRKAGYGVKL